MSRRLLLGLVAVIAVVAAGIGVAAAMSRSIALDEEDHGWEACEAPSIATVPDLGRLGVEPWPGGPVRTVPVADIDRATSLVEVADGSLVVTVKDGLLLRIDAGGEVTTLLDLTDRVSGGSEQGLLDVEPDPDRARLYLTLTNPDGDLELWALDADADGLPLPGTDRVLMTIDQPHEWHNGGDVEVGPDGHLWLSVGDGGSIADPFGNGQDPTTPLSAILRITPTEDGYETPAGNPFSGRSGDERVVAYGFRNPWRIDFGPDGLLWIADVGQYCAEEVNVLDPADLGGNYGWSNLEGTHRFIGRVPEDSVLPVFEYTHDDGGCAIVGAGIHRGSAVPGLAGHYVFADYCRGRLMALEVDGTDVTAVYELGPRHGLLASISPDADGDLYLLTLEDGIKRLVP
ncbi:MAG: PQQ-dependent sugar dehydrogenase [Acidimicrobiia bacterium]